MALVQATRIATLNTPLGGDTLVFHSLSIGEELGRLFSLDIKAGSERGDLKADDLLGKGVSVELKCPRGGVRYFHGFVSRFSRIPRPGTRYFAYQLTAVPWLWFLTRQSDCRIFQKKKLEDILRDVFGRRGFSDFKFQLSGNYTPWEYCVQYRETDFNFVSRLMEQEGVYYYFEHEKDKHTVVFADSPAAHQPFPKYEKLTFSALTTIHEHDQEHVYEWVAESRHHSGKHQYTDYDFTRPSADLKTPESNPGKFAHSDLEIFDYPGEYYNRSDGEQWSKIRMEELRADRETFQGGGDVTGLATGRKFTLSEGPSPADVGDYVVIAGSVDLQSNIYESGTSGEMGDSYHCTFTAIKAADQFRPARLTPKPMIYGLQTAVVTGPKGEEIYTDKYGRIKVQFFWDREGKKDENTTCWIRVAEPWAGKRWGSTFTPRIGQEVVVSFLEGDPDRPMVIGSVYNGDQMRPYLGEGLDSKHKHDPKLTGVMSCSTKGGQGYNELRMDDSKGKEQVFIHAERNMDVRVKNDSLERIIANRYQIIGWEKDGNKGGDQREMVYKDKHLKIHRNHIEQVGGDMQLRVGGIDGQGNQDIQIDADKKETIDGDSHLHVRKSRNERIDASQSLTVGGDQDEKVGTKHALEAGQEIHLKAGMKVIVEAGTQISLKVGGNFVDISPAGVTIMGTMVLINSGGSAGSGSGSHPTAPTDAQKAAPTDPETADDSVTGYPSAPTGS